ncbi:OsmC family protein [Rhizobium sp. 2TAF27]|uniref:OsmC family protein n=1 Tax=Rhizobium sp. 2TAF27 TaxID=3233013 RepID=UPI003F9E9D0E
MLKHRIAARRTDAGMSLANAKLAEVRIHTVIAGFPDTFDPDELLLAPIVACGINGTERITPKLDFNLDDVDICLHAVRHDAPPRIVSVDYEVVVDTDESDQRLELLHKNVRKYGTISNTVAAASHLEGTIRRNS